MGARRAMGMDPCHGSVQGDNERIQRVVVEAEEGAAVVLTLASDCQRAEVSGQGSLGTR